MRTKQLSRSLGVNCSDCGVSYEISGFTSDSGERLPWLVVLIDVSTIREALESAICQRCNDYTMGPALMDIAEKLGYELTDAAVSRRTVAIQPRTSGARVVVPIGAATSTRRTVPITSTTSGGRRTVSIHAPQQSERQALSTAPSASVSASSGTRGSKKHKPARNVASVADVRRHMAKAAKQSASAGGTMGDAFIAQALVAQASGDQGEYDRLIAMAVEAEFMHEITREGIAAKRETEKAEQRTQLEAEQAERVQNRERRHRRFLYRMRRARNFVAQAREAELKCDVNELLDRVVEYINEALKLDLTPGRNRDILLRFVDTSAYELTRMRVAFHLTQTAVRVEDGNVGTYVPRVNIDRSVKALAASEQIFFADNRSYAVCVDSDGTFQVHCPCSVEVFKTSPTPFPRKHDPVPVHEPGQLQERPGPRIIYRDGEQYGDSPFIVMSDDRHQFEGRVRGSDDSAIFMAVGQIALMKCLVDDNGHKDTEYGWSYLAYAEDRETVSKHIRFGTFERGYVTANNLPTRSAIIGEEYIEKPLFVLSVDGLEIDDNGVESVTKLAIAAVLMKADHIAVVEVTHDETLLIGDDVHWLTGQDASSEGMVTLRQMRSKAIKLAEAQAGKPNPAAQSAETPESHPSV